MVITEGIINSVITKATPEEYLAFREALTFDTPNHWFSTAFKTGIWDGKTRFFKSRSFPAGLLFLVQKAMPDVIVRRSQCMNPLIASPKVLRTKKLIGKYAYQLEAVNASFRVKRGIWDCATGAGKTVMAAAFLQTLKRPSLFLVHTQELLEQAYTVFKEEMKIPIGKFGAGEDSRALITVGMVQTLSKRLKQEKKWLASLECVFIDECHLNGARTYKETLMACTNARYRFGISGTPLSRSELDNIRVQAYLGPVFATVRNNVLIETGVSAAPVITMIRFEHGSYGKLPYPVVYDTLIVKNEKRNTLIVETACKFLQGKHRVLVLVNRIDHGFELQRLFERQGITVAFCYGGSEKEERATQIAAIKSGDSQVLILSKIGEVGLDIPELSAMIRASAGKSTVSTLQAIGRLLRNPWSDGRKVQYVDFYDRDGFGYLEKHAQQRKADYAKEGFEIHTS